MAEEDTEKFMAELKENSERLFVLLSKKNMTVEEKQQANAIIEANPKILGWKDFTAKVALPDLMSEYEKNTDVAKLIKQSTQQLQTTKEVLDNLQQMKKEGLLTSTAKPAADVIDTGWAPNGETIATQAFKNVNFLDALKNTSGITAAEKDNVANHTVNDYKAFLHQVYEGENTYGANPQRRNLRGEKAKDVLKNIMIDRKTLQIESVQQNVKQNSLAVEGDKKDMPQKTLTVEELKDRVYQGTATVEQAEQLRKHEDDKKIADMKSQDGDAKKSKREPSNDKFRDEDVIKYMYEDWFLGGASWLFNKTEDAILNLVDAACDLAIDRAEKRRKQKKELKDKELQNRHTRTNDFLQMTGNMMNGLGDECKAKRESYASLMQELKDNLNNPEPRWEHFSPDDPFIKKLEADPAQAQRFIESASQELENRTKMIETTGKIAMLITSTAMADEFMKNPYMFNKNGLPATETQLQEMFAERYQKNQKDILKALSVMAEDNRLLSEAAYNTLPEPKPDLQTFTQERLSKQQNEFLKQLSEQAKEAVALQQNELDEKHFNHKVSSDVRKKLGKISKSIRAKIQGEDIYDKEMFENEHSKERIEAKSGLYEEAMKENSPQSMQKILEYTKELNGYQLETIESRRANAAARKAEVDKFKIQITNRDQSALSSVMEHMKTGKTDRG